MINTKDNLLICKGCRYVIEKENVLSHASKNHRLILDSKYLNKRNETEFLEILNQVNPGINQNLNILSGDLIQGLNIFEGFECQECHYLCRLKNVIQKHMKDNHSVERKNNFENCKLQTLFLHPEKRKYFKVQEPAGIILRDIVETEENEAIFGMKTSQVEPGNSLVDHRFVSLFHKEAELDLITDKFTDEELKEILQIVSPDSMVNAVNIVFNMGEKSSGGSDNYINEFIEDPLSK